MLLELLCRLMWLRLPVLHHMVDCLHPIKDEHEYQEHTVKERCQHIESTIAIIVVSILLFVILIWPRFNIQGIILVLLLWLIPYVDGSGGKPKGHNQYWKVKEVPQNMHILVSEANEAFNKGETCHGHQVQEELVADLRELMGLFFDEWGAVLNVGDSQDVVGDVGSGFGLVGRGVTVNVRVVMCMSVIVWVTMALSMLVTTHLLIFLLFD